MADATRHVTPALNEGDTIEGKYRIIKLLDEGGMGSVYHAVQEPLGRDVAIKVLKPKDDTPEKREQRTKRFFREAQVSSKLMHPNTIVVLDYGTLPDDGGFFFVMEFLKGKSLRHLLQERGALGTRLTLHIAMQIASSLADAHAHNVIHRDLKPPNVMLVRRGDDPYFAKVVDFGLVKELAPEEGAEELTADNALIGSPMYMSPERFLQVKSDAPAVDIYALGIMIYEMLVGRPPFVRDADSTLHHIMLQHVQVEPPPMHSLRDGLELPPGLETLVMRCLEKDPRDRIGSMDTLLQLLRACASGVGMGVAGPVEDMGIFPEAMRPARIESSSDALRVEETGETELQTMEDAEPQFATSNPVQPTDDVEPTATRAGTPWAAVAAGAAVLIGLVVAGFVVLGGEPAPTRLVIDSVPSGATVYVGEEPLGTTPFATPVELEGSQTLRFSLTGFEDFHAPVAPAPGDDVTLKPTLVALPAPIVVEPIEEPEKAEAIEEEVVAEEPPAEPAPKVTPKVRPKQKPVEKPKENIDIKLDR